MNEFIPLKENDPSKIYTLLQKISSGNNKNDLYKIKHKKTGEIFVAKIIKNNLDLYHKQIKSLKKFENPYLVQYYNSFELKDKIWIITEYCDCGNVQDVMKITNKCYKEAEIASIIVMVLKGLQYLHLQKKFHGGIKPSNILLNNDGVIKLSDYNISEQLLLNDDENLNNNNQTKNNIEKSPPELKGKNHLDNYSVKCDIWYLGLTCIELAEGTLDFQEDK
jgi:sporulation-specific protein 1